MLEDKIIPGLEHLEIEIIEPEHNQTITKKDRYPIKGRIKNIPEGIKSNNLSQELGLYVLHTADDTKFWPQSDIKLKRDIERDINPNTENCVNFSSCHWVESSRDMLIVLAGEKAKGAIKFYKECHRKKIFKKAGKWQPIPQEIIGEYIEILAKIHIKFDPK